MQIRKSQDYRINAVANLIESLKDTKYRITSFEIAENVVALIDKIHGLEYKNKHDDFKKDSRAFSGKV
jgi:hypothetical protein